MKLSRLATGVAIALAAGSAHAAAGFEFSHYWTYTHGAGKGAEILSFDSGTNRLWVVGGTGVDVLDPVAKTHSGFSVDLTGLGTPNSVDVHGNLVAVSLSAPVNTDPGTVRFYNSLTGSFITSVNVGATPDMVTFTPDGSRLLVANEAEPNGYNAATSIDPEGSISIIDTGTFTVQTAGFSAFNGQAAALRAAGVRLYGPNATVAQDLEPEYIAMNAAGTKAYVTLQENNALAEVDIATATVSAILPLGLKNHLLAGNGMDASDRDGAGTAALNGNIQTWNVFGMYQPDAVASYEVGGQTYLVTANEGDARDYSALPGGYIEEVRVGAAVVDAALNTTMTGLHGGDWKTNNDKLNRLNVTNATGDTDNDGDLDQIHVFGARSFSIRDTDGDLVFDSGDQIEQIIKAQYPTLWDDARSDNKGPEPEGAVIAQISGRELLFLGLERTNAVMVWDITNPLGVFFLDLLRQAGDIGPEGLTTFQMAGDWFVGFANEVSGTTTLFQVAPVPIPAALPLFASALLGVGMFGRRRSVPAAV